MISIVVGLIALAVALMLSSAIGKAPAGTARMQEIAGYIHEGAMAFLFREYKALSAFVIVVAIVISMFFSAYCSMLRCRCSILRMCRLHRHDRCYQS